MTQRSHDAAVLAEAWRRAVLSLFVREDWLEEDAAVAMLAWPHSGFSAYVGPAIAAEDRAAVLRVARYRARAPVAELRLRYDAERAEVELVSDASEGSYVGVHRFAAVEFLARLVQHIPARGEVKVRYYGANASRRRGWWRRRGVWLAGAGHEQVLDASEREVAPWPALKARRRHRAGGFEGSLGAWAGVAGASAVMRRGRGGSKSLPGGREGPTLAGARKRERKGCVNYFV